MDPRPVTVPGVASSPLSVASSPLSVASSPPSVAPTPTSVRRASNGSKSTEEALDDSDSDSENDASNRDPDSDTNDETGDPGAGHNDSGNDSSDDSGDDGADDDRDSNNSTRVVSHRLALGEEITPSPPHNLSRHRSTRANSIDGVFVLADNDPRVLAELPEVVVNLGGSIRPIDGDDENTVPTAQRKRLALEPAPGDSDSSRKRTPLPLASLSRPTSHDPPPLSVPSSSREASLPAGVSYDGLDGLELDLIPAGGGFPESIENTGTIAFDLYKEFIDPEKLLEALQLLCDLGSSGYSGTSIVVQEGRNPFSVTEERIAESDVLEKMIDASRHAQSQIESSEKVISVLRMKTIMSYITLFLTLEYVVVPKMRLEYPDWPQRRIEGERFQYFQNLLNPNPAGTNRSRFTFRDHITYGGTFWMFGQELGIASLLMIAVSGTAITKIAKKAGPRSKQIPAMAAALSCSQTWWAFAHAVGPCTRHILFGGQDVSYTIPQLLSIVRAEPMPASVMRGIHQRCLEQYLQTDFQPVQDSNLSLSMLSLPTPSLSAPSLSAPLSSALSIFVGDCPIPIQYHPTGVLGDEQVQKRNLAKWLVHTPDTTMVTDTSGTKIPFSDFKTLLPPSDLSPTLVEFFCRLYNSKAIPGRKALVASESLLRPIVNNAITFAGFLDSLAPPSCDLLLCPL